MEKIIVPLENETYDSYIQRIQSLRKLQHIPHETQTHHILPHCLGGKDIKDNLIVLYHSEHFYAHKLLAQEHPDQPGLVRAYWAMSNMCKADDIPITPEEYTDLRRQVSIYNSTQQEHLPWTEEQKMAASERSRKMWERWREEEFERDISALRTPEYRQWCSDRAKNMWEQNKDKWKAEGGGPFKPHTDEWKKEHSRQMSENPPSAKPVVLLNTIDAGMVFPHAKAAGIWQGKGDLVHPGSAIDFCCRGQTLTSGRHPETGERCKWAFYDED